PDHPLTDGNDILQRIARAEKNARDSLLDIHAAPHEIANLADAKWGQTFSERLQNALDDPTIRIIDIPAGRHDLSAINLDRAQHKLIRGHGEDTILTFAKDDAAAFIASSGGHAAKLLFANFVLDMHWQQGDAAANGFQLSRGDTIQFHHIAVKNAGGAAILAQGFAQSGSGTKNLLVLDSHIDGAGLADGTDGFGIMVKDASPDAAIIGNRIENVMGGMGIGGHATALGAPTGMVIIGNHISMQRSATAFESIGLTKGVDNSIIAKNLSDPSFDNGISVSADNNLIVKNHISAAWNHGISIDGNRNTIVANDIHHIGGQNAGLGEQKDYAAIALENAAHNYIANNHASGGDMAYAIKYNGEQRGGNLIGHNAISGYNKSEYNLPPHTDDRIGQNIPDSGIAPLSASERDEIADNAGPEHTANHAPTDITLSASSIGEGKAGIAIGKLATTDPDANDSHTYSVDDPRFEIDNNTLKLKAGQALNYDDAPSITLTITSTDRGGKSHQKTFTLAVEDDPNHPAPPAPQGKEAGLNLDIARHFYPLATLKAFIDTLADAGGTFLHLHLSDNENYALESAHLGQTTANATQRQDGIWINNHTQKPFLSNAQIAELVAYAHAKNIALVPELDMPAHIQGVLDLLRHARGDAYVKSVQVDWTDANGQPVPQLDTNRPETRTLAKTLLDEIAAHFKHARHIHIGGDEFHGAEAHNREYIDFANHLAAHLAGKNLKTRIWNDGILKTALATLNPDIEITYWNFDGDKSGAEAAHNRLVRASLPDLIDAGYTVLNYNNTYLYHLPEAQHHSSFSQSDHEMYTRLKEWHLGLWDGSDNSSAITDTSKIAGAAMSIWGENAGTLAPESIEKFTASQLATLIRMTNAAADPQSADATALENLQNALRNGDYSGIEHPVYLDLDRAPQNGSLDTGALGTQHIRLLRENLLDSRDNFEFFIRGDQNDTLALGQHWQKTGDTATLQNPDYPADQVTYHAYSHGDDKLWIDQDLQILIM
ncbi:MAG: family 20 glycosylhydrolase, partial [Cardiobacteriaceae bacterium]|nr:family 20 glycosylhydrolase [Cardiobacteriaceae bacterium]